MKKKYFILLVFPLLFFSSCLKSIEDEGSNTVCHGTVVVRGSNAPAAGMLITATNGATQGEQTRSDEAGRFSINITAEQLHNGYYLILSADSLYTDTVVRLDGIGFGLPEYTLSPIEVDGPYLPIITTGEVTGITMTSAVGHGDVSDNGRSAIRRRGICWNTASQPTIVNNHVDAGQGTGQFTATMNNLQQGQTYYVRAYAENCMGIAYGQEITFVASDGLPTVITAAVTNVTHNSISCGGRVTSDGGYNVTHRGVCWSATVTEPTLGDSSTDDGTGMGDFSSDITSLQSGTTYYLRAYATNAHGTAYGETKTVTTN